MLEGCNFLPKLLQLWDLKMVDFFPFGSTSKIVQWHVVVRVLRVTKRFCMQTKFSKCQIQKKKIEKGAQPKRKLRIKQGTRICHIRDCQSWLPRALGFLPCPVYNCITQKLKAFFKGNRQTQALQPVAASPLIRDRWPPWGFAGTSLT